MLEYRQLRELAELAADIRNKVKGSKSQLFDGNEPDSGRMSSWGGILCKASCRYDSGNIDLAGLPKSEENCIPVANSLHSCSGCVVLARHDGANVVPVSTWDLCVDINLVAV